MYKNYFELFIPESGVIVIVKYLKNKKQMQKITFTKKSIQFSLWDESAESWQNRDIAESDLPITWFLPYEVYVEDGVTLRHILNHLKPYSGQLNFIFVNYLTGLPFEELLISLDESSDMEEIVKTDAVCLLWVGQVRPIEEEDDNELAVFPSIMALELIGDDEDSEDEFHNIHEMTVKQLLDGPFILDDLLEYYDEDSIDETLFSGVTSWKLFDFISGILKELTIFAFANGIFTKSSDKLPPLSSKELFEHLSDLDKFFKNNSGQS